MSVDHAISFSRLALAKAIKTSDVRDGDNDHKPWTKSVISHQPHVESKMLQTMQNPMRRLLSRHFSKRRSAPITPSTTDDDTPSKHSLHVDEPSPELSKYTLPRPILQDNTMHRGKYHSMHRRTSSTPPSQSLSSAAAAANTKQPLRSCLKRTSKSADADDIPIERCSSPLDKNAVYRPSVENSGNTSKRDHHLSHAQLSPTLASRLDVTHHRSRSVGDLHTQNPPNHPPAPQQASDTSIGDISATGMPSRRVSFRDSLYSSRQSAGISPDVYSQKSTAPVTCSYHQSTRGTRNATATTQQHSFHQHESPEKKHVRIAEDAIRSSNNKRNSSSGKEPSYNLKSSTDARRRAEILRNQRQHHPVAMHTATSPYITPSPSATPVPMIPLLVPSSPSPHPTASPSSYGIPVVFHPNGATATPITGIHMMPSHHHRHYHHSHRRSMHR